MPWRAPSKPGTATAGPALPRAVKPRLNAPSGIALVAAGMSASSQWKKSTRGRSAGISRPTWLTSSPRLGTSKSWQIRTSDLVPDGSSLQPRCGLRLSENVVSVAPSRRPHAYFGGMRSPLGQLSLQSFMVFFLAARTVRCGGAARGVSHAPDDVGALGERAPHHLEHRPGALVQ